MRRLAIHCLQCNTPAPPGAGKCPQCGAFLGKVMQGKYTLLQSLGKGGMGAIYLASDTIANQPRKVVVKEMLDYYDPGNPEEAARAHERFRMEAATLASLTIAGIPQIYDYFSEGERNYIVMTFVEGRNLESGLSHLDDNGNLVSGHAYPVDQVRRWGIVLCNILASLAAQNVIHMDIKPANLILDRNGAVWLVDFGTAKAPRFTALAKKPGLQKSSIYGTIGYAPPEQIAGKPEARSDVYALAATLYHLMTDDDPRDQPNAFSQIDRLPPDVAATLRLALAKDVRQRLSATEFGRQLDKTVGGSKPFRWQDGTVAYRPEDLAATADRKWEEALGYYSRDEWSRWFKDLHRHDIVARLQQIKSNQHDPDLALDAFLRYLDPAYPPPRLGLSVLELVAGILPWESKRSLDLMIENHGSGCLHGRFENISPGLQVEPASFTIHDTLQIKVTVDAGALDPASGRQLLCMDIESGPGGSEQLSVIVVVPEPKANVQQAEPHLGPAPRGKTASGHLFLSNQGGSAFAGTVSSSVGWLQVQPQKFRCQPGQRSKLELLADAKQLSFGRHTAQVHARLQAGSWEQAHTIVVVVDVSVWETFLEYGLPPLLWAGGGVSYGVVLGTMFGWLLTGLRVQIFATGASMLLGALIGILLFVLPGGFLGYFGVFQDKAGIDGMKQSAVYAALPGLFLGGLSGWLVRGLLTAFRASWYPGGLPLGTFGALTGAVAGGLLGLILWWLRE